MDNPGPPHILPRPSRDFPDPQKEAAGAPTGMSDQRSLVVSIRDEAGVNGGKVYTGQVPER